MISASEVIRPGQFDEFRAWSRDHQDYAHYISLVRPPRPGVSALITCTEYYYFSPGTPENLIFECHTIELLDNIFFSVMSVPKGKRLLVERVARQVGLSVVRGEPMLADSDEQTRFPIDSRFTYWTQNTAGHPVYTASDDQMTIFHQREQAFVNRIWKGERPDLMTFMQTIFG